MTWRIPILVGLMTLSVSSAANADPVRPRALSFSVSAGKPSAYRARTRRCRR